MRKRQGLVAHAKALEALAKIMKTIKNVFESLLDKEKIKEIIILASKHKTKRREVKEVLNNIDNYADKIYGMLESGNYEIKPTVTREINEYGKTRILTVSPFYPNRILDYIIVETLKPYIRKSMYEYCVGNVDGRGITYGKKAIEKNYRKYNYYIKLDIHHFYPSVSSSQLVEMLQKRITDKRFLDLCTALVGSIPVMPIGSYYSQWFSNWFLQELDHKIKEEWHVEFYIRYVDDMLLMSNSKRRLLNAMHEINKWLVGHNLQLKRKENVKITSISPIDFLGFSFREDMVYLRIRNFKKINKCVKHIRLKKHVCLSQAQRLLSFLGLLKQIKFGYIYYKNHIENVVKIGTLKRIISNWSKSKKSY